LTATGIYTCVTGLITDVTEKSAQNQVLEGNPLLNSFPIEYCPSKEMWSTPGKEKNL